MTKTTRPPGKTGAQRQKERRQRLKDDGLTEITLVLPTDAVKDIKNRCAISVERHLKNLQNLRVQTRP